MRPMIFMEGKAGDLLACVLTKGVGKYQKG